MKVGMRHVPGAAKLAIAASCTALGLLVAACQGTPSAAHSGKPERGNGSSQASASAQISITPRNGASSAKPNHGVTVTVSHGKLSSVHVTAGSDRMAGTLSNGGMVWHSRWALRTGTGYVVTATAVGANHKMVTATSSFRTLTPSATDTASTAIGNQDYGVGLPIMICFSSPVTRAHQAQVERSIEIKSS